MFKKMRLAIKNAWTALSHKFDVAFSVKSKKEPEKSVVNVHVNGQIPPAVVIAAALVGLVAVVTLAYKLIKAITDF